MRPYRFQKYRVRPFAILEMLDGGWHVARGGASDLSHAAALHDYTANDVTIRLVDDGCLR